MRYALFAGKTFPPLGGYEDFVDSFDSESAAYRHALEKKYEWYHIVDSHSHTIVHSDESTFDEEIEL